MKSSLLLLSAMLFATVLFAQSFPEPVNGITKKTTLTESQPLPYQHLREADILWEKTVWRVIDVREKMNLPFSYPERPFFSILKEAADKSQIQLYANDDFTEVLSDESRGSIAGTVDTILITNPITHEQTQRIITNDFDVRDIKRYRVKEVWYVDRATSRLNIRILGISPLKNKYDNNGNFLYELPLFWVYYPAARKVLSGERAPLINHIAAARSWEDLFESRFFSSMILKESNIYDRRINAYLAGRSALLEGEKIDQSIFNFEQDLWTE